MAFSKAPVNDTYSSHRVPLAWPLRLRLGNQNFNTTNPLQAQDEGMVNALPIIQEEGEQKNLLAVTRPAIAGTTITAGAITAQVRGMYVWEKTAGTVYYFLVAGQNIYTTTGSGGVPTANSWTLVNTLITNATTPVRFTEYIDDTNTKKLILVDGVEGYVFTSNAAGTKITDVDFPSPHIPFPVFLDGYLFLAKAGTGDIYNSNLNDPTAWTAGDFISTEIFPDDVQALIKVNDYILAIGLQGSEYFYDAANSTGSPLAHVEGGLLPFGTQFPNSIACNKSEIVMLANLNDGQTTFVAIDGFKFTNIDSLSVVPMYHRMIRTPIPAANCRGWFFRQGGALFYNFLFDGVRSGADRQSNKNMCYTYSFNAKAWTELQYGQNSTDRAARYAFGVTASSSASTGYDTTYVAGNLGSTDNAFFGVLDDLSATDSIDSIVNALYVEFRTPNLDFGTLNRKAMNRVGVIVECGDPVVFTAMTISWNDQDYNALQWSASRTISSQNDLSTRDYYPFITQLGTFRRRALKIVCTTGKAFRARYLEIDINKGQQ